MSRDGVSHPDLAVQRAGHAVLAKLASLHLAHMNAGQGLITSVDELVSWAVGYLGEVMVGTHLAGLDRRWRVLHAIPLGRRGKDLDHLVIGPAGIFAINTKHHSGARVTVKGRDAVYVNGTWKRYLNDARRDAGHVQELLAPAGPVEVRAVVCLVDARLTVTTPGEGVCVVDAADLVPWLMEQPETMDADVVDRIFTPVPSAAKPIQPAPAATVAVPAVPIPRRSPTDPQEHAGSPPVQRRERRGSVWLRVPTRGHGLDLLKGVLALASVLAIMLAGPDRIEGFIRPLIDSVTQRLVTDTFPHPTGTDPTLPTPAMGTACSVRTERARSVLDGSMIECLPLPPGGALHWQHPKEAHTPPTASPSR